MSEFAISRGMMVSYHDDHSLLATTIGTKDKRPSAVPDPEENNQTNRVAVWGDDNQFPNYVVEEVDKTSLLGPALHWKAKALYGGGLAYGKIRVVDGEESFEQIFDPEIDDWMEATDIMQYCMEASVYYQYFYNIFPELVQSINGSKINFLSCKESVDCRWELRQAKGQERGLVKMAYMSPDWQRYSDPKSDDLVKWKVINTQRDPQGFVQSHKNEAFIYPVSYPSPGRTYYQKAPWHVLFETWLPIAQEIPRFKKALLKNQLTIKYIIEVPEWWWSWKYKDWDKKTEAERIKLIKSEHEDFKKFFSDDKQGGSLMYTKRDSTPAKEYGEWKVTVIDDKMKSGMYIEDSQEADAHIFKNLLVDPTLFGSGPGKNNQSSGSGSDKRVAWNNYIIQQKGDQDLILKPLSFISKYNGWTQRLANPANGERFVWWFKNYQIARLDSGSETQEAQPK